jgi:hypothetical protein
MADLFPSLAPASIPSALPPSIGFVNIPVTNVGDDGCGLGFLCDEDRMANCTLIRARAVALGFGDVHAGMTCPENVDGYRNCKAGFYCPSPVCNVLYYTVLCIV